MKIYILRHGESTTNAAKMLPVDDAPLTEKGRKQAEDAAQYLAGEKIEAAYSSTLTRAVQTAQIVAYEAQCPIIFKKGLVDISFGKLAGRNDNGTDAEVGEAMAERRQNHLNYRFPAGESYRNVRARVAPVAAEIASSGLNKAAVVGHLIVNRIMISELLGITLEDCTKIRQDNDCIYIIDTASKKATHKSGDKIGSGLLLKEAD